MILYYKSRKYNISYSEVANYVKKKGLITRQDIYNFIEDNKKELTKNRIIRKYNRRRTKIEKGDYNI